MSSNTADDGAEWVSVPLKGKGKAKGKRGVGTGASATAAATVASAAKAAGTGPLSVYDQLASIREESKAFEALPGEYSRYRHSAHSCLRACVYACETTYMTTLLDAVIRLLSVELLRQSRTFLIDAPFGSCFPLSTTHTAYVASDRRNRSVNLLNNVISKAIAIIEEPFFVDTVARIQATHRGLSTLKSYFEVQRGKLRSTLARESAPEPQPAEDKLPTKKGKGTEIPKWREVLRKAILDLPTQTTSQEGRQPAITSTAGSESKASELTDSKSLQESDTAPKFVAAQCLGIGPFARSQPGQCQLAFFLALCALFDIPDDKIYVYDPVLSGLERTVLVEYFGIHLPERNTEGKTRLVLHESQAPAATTTNKNTLVLHYLPHCGIGLSSNILWAHWGKDIDRHILIANDTSMALTSARMSGSMVLPADVESVSKEMPSNSSLAALFPESKEYQASLRVTSSCSWATLARLSPLLSESPLQPQLCPSATLGAFNDTSIQVVDCSKLPEDDVRELFWKTQPPEYVILPADPDTDAAHTAESIPESAKITNGPILPSSFPQSSGKAADPEIIPGSLCIL